MNSSLVIIVIIIIYYFMLLCYIVKKIKFRSVKWARREHSETAMTFV